MFVMHVDTTHRHLHVIVNRIHGFTGVTADLSYSGRKLSIWARSYEEKKGGIRCTARRSAAEDQQWDDLFRRQRDAGTDPEGRREEREELAQEINDKRGSRGLPPAAWPDRHARFRRQGRGQEYTPAEKARRHEQYRRHERENTPATERRKERAALASRLATERHIRVRAAAADVKVDILIVREDAPSDAGVPASIERWRYVAANLIPLAEENQRHTIRARLVAGKTFTDIESLLSGEQASWNSCTPPDSLERYLFLERIFPPPERPFEDADDDSWLPSSEKQRRQEIRDRASAAGVPGIEGFVRQSPHRPERRTSALSLHTISNRDSRPRDGFANTARRWDYIDRDVIARWRAIWSFWNAAPRPLAVVLKQTPEVEKDDRLKARAERRAPHRTLRVRRAANSQQPCSGLLSAP